VKSGKAAVIFIFVTVVLDMLALGLVAPVLPKLILGFLNNDMKRAADWNGIFLTVFAAMQFFFSPIIGVLSDRIGRRPVFSAASFRGSLHLAFRLQWPISRTLPLAKNAPARSD